MLAPATIRAPRAVLALACLLFWEFSAGCGGGANSAGSGSTATNPVPIITSLSPNSANVGGATFTLMIAGDNFISSSMVQWNGIPRATNYSSSTQVQAQISESDITNSGSAAVSISNPPPGGGNSGAAEFTINPISNPVPSVTSLSPSLVNAGTAGCLLTVNGTNFVPASIIEWNGTALSTTYLSESQLEAEIPASNLTAPEFTAVVVSNPAPGGGISPAAIFTIAYVPTVVNQAANDLVWDPTHQLIFLSAPSLAESNGNTVVALNPITGTIQSSQFAGSEPDKLGISDDNQFLYAALNGASSVRRFALPNLSPDLEYSLGADPVYGPYYAVDLQVAPSLPHST